MIGIDTNLLVRFLTNDDKKQAKQVAKLIEKNKVFIPKSVLLETEWVLRYTYELESSIIHHAFTRLLGLKQVTVEDPICISKALMWYDNKMDFADALHLASSHATEAFATFDKDFMKQGKKLGVEFITLS